MRALRRLYEHLLENPLRGLALAMSAAAVLMSLLNGAVGRPAAAAVAPGLDEASGALAAGRAGCLGEAVSVLEGNLWTDMHGGLLVVCDGSLRIFEGGRLTAVGAFVPLSARHEVSPGAEMDVEAYVVDVLAHGSETEIVMAREAPADGEAGPWTLTIEGLGRPYTQVATEGATTP